eukprot:TRINITY_DN29425_c0_g1_i1.p1 TRINITY_DN29425_c0_g1~~TRINITY_DN29425_c0_g1_i1.p1  ORF type:complete len:324 (-),score=48.47 TRINITY_DN29425_c0_g1_i1:313-1218(-)
MISATDPVAVLAGMKELGCDPRLVTIVGGESVLNDGCAVVIFTLLYTVVFSGASLSTAKVVEFAFLQTIGAVALSSVFLGATLAALKFCRKEAPVVITILVSVPFLCFYAAMLIETSGIIAMVAFGLGLNWFGKSLLDAALLEESRAVWESVEFFANTFVFAISGAIMAAGLQASHVTIKDWGLLLVVYVVSQAARGIAILVFYPFMNCVGPPMTWKDALFTWWGGLKGAVGLSVAMIVHMSIPKEDPLAPTGFKFMFYMSGVYMLTAVINATTAGSLVKGLSLNAKLTYEQPLLQSASNA